jgi:hypothetical protein
MVGCDTNLNRGEKMFKKKIFYLILLFIIFGAFLSASFTVSAGKRYYWLVTDGDIDPQSVSIEVIDIWTGLGLEQRIANFQWYVELSGSRGSTPISSYDISLGGTKAKLSMSDVDNDWLLQIRIYRGGEKNPTTGPEEYNWRIINGKDSYRDSINVVFTDTATGKTSKAISLYQNDEIIVGIPHCAEFTCRMWLT